MWLHFGLAIHPSNQGQAYLQREESMQKLAHGSFRSEAQLSITSGIIYYFKMTYPKRYPKTDSIRILFHLAYQSIKMLSYILYEALAEIYGVGITGFKLTLWIIIYALQKASKEPHACVFTAKRSENIGWFMKIAVTLTQDGHDPNACLQLHRSRPSVPVHLGTKILWRNSACTDVAIHHLH